MVHKKAAKGKFIWNFVPTNPQTGLQEALKHFNTRDVLRLSEDWIQKLEKIANHAFGMGMLE